MTRRELYDQVDELFNEHCSDLSDEDFLGLCEDLSEMFSNAFNARQEELDPS